MKVIEYTLGIQDNCELLKIALSNNQTTKINVFSQRSICRREHFDEFSHKKPDKLALLCIYENL